jgi:gas vesicle protein
MADNGLDKFITGVLAGALIGTAIGMLLAPKPGNETRQIVRERAGEYLETARERAGGYIGAARERAAGPLEAARERAAGPIGAARERIQRVRGNNSSDTPDIVEDVDIGDAPKPSQTVES